MHDDQVYRHNITEDSKVTEDIKLLTDMLFRIQSKLDQFDAEIRKLDQYLKEKGLDKSQKG